MTGRTSAQLVCWRSHSLRGSLRRSDTLCTEKTSVTNFWDNNRTVVRTLLVSSRAQLSGAQHPRESRDTQSWSHLRFDWSFLMFAGKHRWARPFGSFTPKGYFSGQKLCQQGHHSTGNWMGRGCTLPSGTRPACCAQVTISCLQS